MKDEIFELSCNLDDMTGEELGFASEMLLNAGALDVYTIPIGMKKNRPGTMLTVLCRADQREEMVRLLLRHTSTLGIRESVCRRFTLTRREETVDTPYGKVRCKISEGYGVCRRKPEYDDLSAIAEAQQLPLSEIRRSFQSE